MPPFGDTNYVSTNHFISGFEGTNFGVFTNVLIYTNGNLFTSTESYDDWRVNTNRVYVQTNDWLAYSDTISEVRSVQPSSTTTQRSGRTV